MAVKKRQKALKSGRPPIAAKNEHMSSKQSRTIIRTHHRLEKERAAAIRKGDQLTADEISKAIEKNGGLKTYQAASKQGQSSLRGGDSSKLLVEWLQQAKLLAPGGHEKAPNGDFKAPFRLLEIGALSTENKISQFPKTIQVTRIDLNSQGPGIEKQDFMERPLPASDEGRFDIISLSLVLNFVPDAAQRGEMLQRVTKFLRAQVRNDKDGSVILPALFLVLPLPCVQNSRYLDEKLLLRIMDSLGFVLTHSKSTPKLCYYLFRLAGSVSGIKVEKRILRDGPTKNNFCIVLE